MSPLLEKALAELAKFPEEEQEHFAYRLLEAMESERRWDELFAKSQDMLERMAAEAHAEYLAGETIDLP